MAENGFACVHIQGESGKTAFSGFVKQPDGIFLKIIVGPYSM